MFLASCKRLAVKEEGRMLVKDIPAFLTVSSKAWYSFAEREVRKERGKEEKGCKRRKGGQR
jgi:hypothetical protein